MSDNGAKARDMAEYTAQRLGYPDYPAIATVYALLDVADAIRELARSNQEAPS